VAVATAAGIPANIAAATISRLVKQGRVRRLDEGGYALVETPAGAARWGRHRRPPTPPPRRATRPAPRRRPPRLAPRQPGSRRAEDPRGPGRAFGRMATAARRPCHPPAVARGVGEPGAEPAINRSSRRPRAAGPMVQGVPLAGGESPAGASRFHA
jgi:hypothetical protein